MSLPAKAQRDLENAYEAICHCASCEWLRNFKRKSITYGAKLGLNRSFVLSTLKSAERLVKCQRGGEISQ